MAEYIEREALLKKMFPYEGIDKKTYAINAKAVETAIVDAPTENVEEVVYCKDCEYLEVTWCYGECAKGILGIVTRHDFCSRGKRRANDEQR